MGQRRVESPQHGTMGRHQVRIHLTMQDTSVRLRVVACLERHFQPDPKDGAVKRMRRCCILHFTGNSTLTSSPSSVKPCCRPGWPYAGMWWGVLTAAGGTGQKPSKRNNRPEPLAIAYSAPVNISGLFVYISKNMQSTLWSRRLCRRVATVPFTMRSLGRGMAVYWPFRNPVSRVATPRSVTQGAR